MPFQADAFETSVSAIPPFRHFLSRYRQIALIAATALLGEVRPGINVPAHDTLDE
jgi:hypothetical protein